MSDIDSLQENVRILNDNNTATDRGAKASYKALKTQVDRLTTNHEAMVRWVKANNDRMHDVLKKQSEIIERQQEALAAQKQAIDSFCFDNIMVLGTLLGHL
ncbi:uncharacterized protein VDAG_05500 [Verticillium dahliae VdLs.17]|uniref:Uncharacterized protein n=1 Tax=Verticillium dahliae (strain VdLs.17 / ATCC MYA-4575 / FGSC 10137) TaxID=498257 RepID=G2X5J5_VERDV|nr:uncharacterized protein VDAG_05500 [Verticillium dahliae VdLs.17]EGY14336.1 hypothetical protein VDAG_05500 [Verticillium dahliae VdLs.17]